MSVACGAAHTTHPKDSEMSEHYRVRCTNCGWTERTLSVDETEQVKRSHLRRWHPDAKPATSSAVTFAVKVLDALPTTCPHCNTPMRFYPPGFGGNTGPVVECSTDGYFAEYNAEDEIIRGGTTHAERAAGAGGGGNRATWPPDPPPPPPGRKGP